MPMIFVGTTTITAGIMNLKNLFIPQIFKQATHIQGIINSGLTLLILICVISVVVDAIPKWLKAYNKRN
jgi:carbon starvation protein CstA